ncbi:MAG TPA: hypothetical protein VLA74_09445 [Nitrososphaeraceae archaeon]|nr:hypothetical protein [Nitrososphaeraceae archaeon]
MKTPKYICAKCRLPFTRRWNANRHCNNKHSGYLEHIISFTDYIINRQDSAALNNLYKDNNSHQKNVLKNQVFFDKPISANRSLFDSITDPFEYFLDQELLPYEVLNPLGPKYEELRSILDFLPESSRNQILGIVLSTAINSDNPVETMQKKIIEYSKSKSNVMMLNDLTRFYGGDKEYTKQLLKLKAKQKKGRYH